jgi:DNA-binding NtrC family response regulator
MMKESLNPLDPVLLVDDEAAWLRSLTILLERSLGINNVIAVQDGHEAMTVLGRLRVSLVLLDITMPHLTGDQMLGSIMERFPETPVIIHTGRNEVDIAVRCMKMGAFDYFVKTVEQERLVGGIRRALAMSELKEENRRLKQGLISQELQSPETFAEVVTANCEMRAIFRYVEAIAGSREPVLITGESGVGKDLIARAIHRLCAPAGPWQAVNVAGLDDNVFSDTLFGHVRGAFTGADQPRSGLIEQASGGVLFLDEIGDLSPASQVKLLRLLQDGDYFPLGSDRPSKMNVRVVAATNQELETKVATGAFRMDLYYRLKAHHVHIPPLRERRDDIPLLLDHFLEEAAGSLGKPTPTVPGTIFDLLGTYHFPGNVRELRAMIYDAVSQHNSGVLALRRFDKAMGSPLTSSAATPDVAAPAGELLSFSARLPTLKQAGNLLVQEAMRRANGNQTQAAKLLGISRPALIKRLQK